MFDNDMNIAAGTIERPSNGLGIVAVVCGVAGAAVTAILWFCQRRPFSPWLGEYGFEIAHGGQLRDDLIMLAGLLAVVAMLGAVLSWIGGSATSSSVFALLCGVFALTYPAFAWLDVLQAPLQRQLFLGS
jgi:hypothetical protein